MQPAIRCCLFFIFPRQDFKDRFIRDGPTGCVGVTHPSGWMTTENILVLIKYSAKHARPSTENPVLLLLDNHHSHLGIEAELCKGKWNYNVIVPTSLLSYITTAWPYSSWTFQEVRKDVSGQLIRNNPGKSQFKICLEY